MRRSCCSRFFALLLATLALLPLLSCEKRRDRPRGARPSAERAALLAAVAECALSTYREAHSEISALRTATKAAESDPSAAKRQAARDAWSAAMSKWQQAELMRFGPAAALGDPGGKELRDQIYSWPLTGRCLVEQQLVEKGYESADFASSLVNLRGLDAAEYLLFYEGTDNACAASATINTDGSWAALAATELQARKAAYAAVVMADVAARSAALVDAWDPAKGNFVAELSEAGKGSKTYSTDLRALNVVSDAMFYVDKELKDMKLARPLGLLECASATCPEALESRYAHRSKQHVLNNLLGFRKLFSGCGPDGEGRGVDDLLVELGAEDLAQRMTQALSGAIEAVHAIEEDDLAQALAADYASVQALHGAIKVLTDMQKTELVTVLTLDLPPLVQGDND